MSKIRVGVLFGGESGEHEVSVASARAVFASLDPARYEPVAIGITREGRWLTAPSPQHLLQGEVTLALPQVTEAVPAVTSGGLLASNGHQHAPLDVIFPVLHGTNGEDGTVQGLLELAHMPYVGSQVLASALCLDKVVMKMVLAQAGMPSVPYQLIRASEWERDRDPILDQLEGALAFPMFVKPCNTGSSVGISKVRDREALAGAIHRAARLDRRIIVEQGIEAREIECAVLGNDTALVSVPGEVISRHDFYDYEAKYSEDLAELIIPAPVSREQTRTLQEMARRAFQAVDAAGLARVDFFLDRHSGEILINEVNTMPGFTATSMYAKLWEASGVPYSQVVDRLIELALERHGQRSSRDGLSG